MGHKKGSASSPFVGLFPDKYSDIYGWKVTESLVYKKVLKNGLIWLDFRGHVRAREIWL